MSQDRGADKHTVPVKFVKRRGQRYIRIRVKPGEIIVSAPYGTPDYDLNHFLQEKKEWVEKSLLAMRRRREETIQKNKFDEGFLLYEGKWVPVEKSFTLNQKRVIFKKTANGFFLELPRDIPISEEFIAEMYMSWATQRLKLEFNRIAAAKGFRFNKVTIRNQKTKWGSCSAKGNISLNWRLIKCPPLVMDYIFVHELCHLVHLNHSKAYWNLVEKHYPQWKEAERWIKTNGALVFQNP
ncbi:MAG: M48 family metallopeptidase [Balneolales bacterium]|nr:M48 family metallopeptidase [Balneolales bacterium]